MHCPKMIPSIAMALIAMLLSPCIAYPNPKPNPVRQGHAIPPMLMPLRHDKSPPPPLACAPATSTAPPPVHTSQSPPQLLRQSHPVSPHPFPRQPIPRPRLPLTPPSVSGVPLPPTLNPTNPTPAPPTNGYSSETIYAIPPAQPPVVPHHRFPPSPPRRQFPPHHQFPPRHGGVPTPPSN